MEILKHYPQVYHGPSSGHKSDWGRFYHRITQNGGAFGTEVTDREKGNEHLSSGKEG